MATIGPTTSATEQNAALPSRPQEVDLQPWAIMSELRAWLRCNHLSRRCQSPMCQITCKRGSSRATFTWTDLSSIDQQVPERCRLFARLDTTIKHATAASERSLICGEFQSANKADSPSLTVHNLHNLISQQLSASSSIMAAVSFIPARIICPSSLLRKAPWRTDHSLYEFMIQSLRPERAGVLWDTPKAFDVVGPGSNM